MSMKRKYVRRAIDDADAADGAAEAATVPKRGPGRPPSLPPMPELEMRGIVGSPSHPDHLIEFAYGRPAIFKSLFTYLKNVKSQDIHIRFSPVGITFFARDHVKKSKIIAVIDGSKANWFYCHEKMDFVLRRDLVDNMFASIDKSFYKCTIIYSQVFPDALQFVFKDPTADKECSYQINVALPMEDTDLYESEKETKTDYIEANFPVHFTLSAKMFKKSLTDLCREVDTVHIEKLGDAPLQLTFGKEGMEFHEIYRNAEKIKLHSTITRESIFRIALQIENIKYLAGAMVADEIRICCRSDGDILFRSDDDNKIMIVNTLTNIAEVRHFSGP
jgi:hypothetical protein